MQPDLLVIFETTGAYHPQLERALGTHSVSFVKVIPKQALRFAQASGKLAKTGRIDCEMLAKMGAALKLVPKPLPAENLAEQGRSLLIFSGIVKTSQVCFDFAPLFLCSINL